LYTGLGTHLVAFSQNIILGGKLNPFYKKTCNCTVWKSTPLQVQIEEAVNELAVTMATTMMQQVALSVACFMLCCRVEGGTFKVAETCFMMCCRVEEGTFKVAETTADLQTQRRRNALLEKQLGKAKVDQVPSGV